MTTCGFSQAVLQLFTQPCDLQPFLDVLHPYIMMQHEILSPQQWAWSMPRPASRELCNATHMTTLPLQLRCQVLLHLYSA